MLRRIFGLALSVCACAAAADAQSFGRNKVHYDGLDFRVLQTAHFDIHYYPAEYNAAVDAARLAERWYERLSTRLDNRFDTRQPIVLYASHAQFAQTNVVPGVVPEGVGGVTDQDRGRVVLPFAVGLGETDHVLGHELVHAFQRDILKKHGRQMTAMPLWFIEGMAEYVSIGGLDVNTTMWLRDAAAADRLPRIDQLDDPRWFPYRFGQALWTFLAERYGDAIVASSLTTRARGTTVARLVALTGKTSSELSTDWHQWIRTRTMPSGEEPAFPKSRPIVTEAGGGRLNVAPALSPDGRSLVFLSEKDQYSIDVYLADAVTGTVSRKLVETAGDPHFDSLQFIESAGGWDPSGRRFALAALAGGAAVISILDTTRGGVDREYPIRGADQVFGPTWSPDGKRIAFSAMAGGYSDLYILDLQTGRVQALTRDAFADVQPAWSPDGRTIAFSTDRFTSSLETLSFGHFRLASIDVETAVVSELPSVPSAKNIDPHWSHDGASLYFLADGDEVSNVYRLDVAGGDLFKVTTDAVGVSGVTALSPALSVAGPDDRLAFSVYRNGAFEIHTKAIGRRTTMAAFARAAQSVPTPAAQEIPLAPASSFSHRPYRAALSLDRYVQPYLSTGGGSTGEFIRGGAGLSFADMLGNRQLDVAVLAASRADDIIFQAGYTNRTSRLNWGISAGLVPWQQDGVRQVHRQLSATASYPLSAARRLEFTTGVDSIGLVEVGAGFVHDTSTSGPVSPVTGERYRLDIEPTLGSARFVTLTADYRRYVTPAAPFTIAIRAMDIARVGSGADDARLLPIVWTLRDVVRGYRDTERNAAGSLDIRATNMLAANLELRYPIHGVQGLLFVDALHTSRTLRSAGAGVRLRVLGIVVELDAVKPFDAARSGWTFSFNFRPGF